MKLTQFANKSDAELALELKEVIEQRKANEKREEQLKSYFRDRLEMLGQDTANLGGILISIVEMSRTGIDQDAINVKMGDGFLKQFATKTIYKKVDVKEMSVNLLKKAS